MNEEEGNFQLFRMIISLALSIHLDMFLLVHWAINNFC